MTSETAGDPGTTAYAREKAACEILRARHPDLDPEVIRLAVMNGGVDEHELEDEDERHPFLTEMAFHLPAGYDGRVWSVGSVDWSGGDAAIDEDLYDTLEEARAAREG